mmetsp:Transcript_26144/g.57243  ORF Transcript_26144/g.57243 Transcript_26144/m.57243 type:complete len:671 (-) Transcript_26144:1359-3371(-)|eukprot:CAMPEP_0168271680 /NCGR_PEP_ID=MMETSP0141_2-20121125/15748_1 /TAXON_ID=44445 /ORGANISM="Pseudo-nitzschia australis, Strain 10249 10 AB" /LENGTH=670 /DNA_ID=CAMNT_0008212925 /DNA_START=153 /DNA_END=2165 /DNA_ORIENTATION=-
MARNAANSPAVKYNSYRFDEDEILNRFKVLSHDIGDKVISLSEDVLLTCDSWSDPNSNIMKLEAAISDPRKKHLVFYDMWHDSVVEGILGLFSKHRDRYWSSIEFRGCQERHINAVLESALQLDIVQTVAFSLTNDRYNPTRICNTTFHIISRSMQGNKRFECLIFHSRPLHFIQYEALQFINVKRLHFLEGIVLHPNEIPELAAGIKANHSLISFSFLGGTQVSNGNGIAKIVDALKSHPSLKRLILCLKSTSESGVTGLSDVLKCPNSVLESLTLTGGFTLNSFFPKATFSKGLAMSKLKHLHLRDIFLFQDDVQDMAVGMRKNRSIESLSIKLEASSMRVDVAPIALAIQDNNRIQRLALSGKCSLGEGVFGIANLLSSNQSKLKDLHLSGAFYDKPSRNPTFLRIFLNGLRGNKKLESLDLSVNALSDQEVSMIYNEISTCHSLNNLDLGMNDITSQVVGSFAKVKTPNQLGVLRISSQRFSFFEINDRVCRRLIKLLTTNPRLGDVNFNMGPVEWHHSYQENGTMKWHHFFPSYLTYALHFNNKRVNYLKTKELSKGGRRDLERIQYLLDYNWSGRCLVSQNIDQNIPISLWPKVMERIWKGRTCFWTGREQGTRLECAHSVTYSFLREHLLVIFKSGNEAKTTQDVKRKQADRKVDGNKRLKAP